ncbi:trihelix transcription factor ENAP2 isoform X1 [Cryptomeria japonica]|uniref:trihelix transcription factor ENAP2 isoform X1 n=1 Tax=Cryptomeria japonica TaxID=3369 RepID=UPI0025ABE13F|nr:trihelix transcription factor ENAP2 isoform X1 [Cryptomeria japonica]
MEDGNNSRRLHHHGAAAEGGVASSNGLTLSLPLRSAAAGEPLAAAVGAPAERGGGGGRDDVWSQVATMTLIEAWGNRYLELNRGNLKQKHWKEVADAVNTRPGSNSKQPKTDVQCKNRLDTLKKKYKVEKSRILGGGASKWALFNRMDDLIGPSRKNQLQLQQHHKPLNHYSPPPPHPPPPLLLTAATHSPDMLIPNAGVNNYNSHQQRMNNTESPDMTESWVNDRRQQQTDHVVALKEVASAIVKFGEVYERIEVLKQQQIIDLEKQRMEFIKDLELQRMHLFMQTQLELAKIKHGKQENSTECQKLTLEAFFNKVEGHFGV